MDACQRACLHACENPGIPHVCLFLSYQTAGFSPNKRKYEPLPHLFMKAHSIIFHGVFHAHVKNCFYGGRDMLFLKTHTKKIHFTNALNNLACRIAWVVCLCSSFTTRLRLEISLAGTLLPSTGQQKHICL